ncbi:lipocalin family protein [Methylophaga thiooxydans]|uniref:Outer membrane lipoprotein Blc n=1 Tax=Methylophaga thiooxydans DMS010 TaxID=637616 RepID=C0N796_9GAMM|nr:lipocalin family protein [Methylophaga thiooxydans]EEF79342.1 Lipocalin-like domain, putative [Methylophaga thiooxydans DMS010]
MKELKILLITVMSFMLAACFGMPETVTPVKNFEVERYLGKWYEIARLDHSFERGLNNVSAEYTIRDDGGIAVVNRGYSVEERQWKTAEGKAYFVNDKDEAYLKVSFFGPFYSSYVVFELEQHNYDYAFISGPDTSYLWLLSRTPDVEQGVIDNFITMSQERGFDTSELIFVNHDKSSHGD